MFSQTSSLNGTQSRRNRRRRQILTYRGIQNSRQSSQSQSSQSILVSEQRSPLIESTSHQAIIRPLRVILTPLSQQNIIRSQHQQRITRTIPQLRVILTRLSDEQMNTYTSSITQNIPFIRTLKVVLTRLSEQQLVTLTSGPRQQSHLRVILPRIPLNDLCRLQPPVQRELKIILERIPLTDLVRTQQNEQLIHDDNNENNNDINVNDIRDPIVIDEVRPPSPPPLRRVWGNNIARKRIWKMAVNTLYPQLRQLCETPFSLGPLDNRCTACRALFFRNECVIRQGTRRLCCRNGTIVLPDLRPAPRELRELYTGDGNRCDQFRTKIRYFNGLLAMTSFTATVPGADQIQNIQQSFAITGSIYHLYNGVPNTQDLEQPRLNHYYFLDIADALNVRREFIADADVDAELLESVERILRQVNPYMRAYRTMGEELARERAARPARDHTINICIGFLNNTNRERRNFNLPESRSEIAAIFMGPEPPFQVDLLLYPRADLGLGARRHHKIHNLSHMADPMVYPLLFPGGDDGRSILLRRTDGGNVSCRQFYRYRIQIRNDFDILSYGQKLFQQYLVDAWCKAESDTLWYLRRNQHKFRLAAQESIARYNRLRAIRAAFGDGIGAPEVENIGRPVILPVSFEGGERNQQRRYIEAMAVIARHGKPDLLITFTCNPTWPEIVENLPPHQYWENRPDLVCRVFNLKLKELMDDIVHKQLYGVVLNYHYVIEFQKRGLPHAHIVLTFVTDDKIHTAEDVDGIVCAVIPDEDEEPEMYQRVAHHQIHSACAVHGQQASCIIGGKCRFNFPQEFSQQTIVNRGSNQRPIYKRPRDNRTIRLNNRVFDNRRIVPYNPYTLAKYNCHHNFEVVGSIKTMKYLHKYLNKGSDSVTVDVDAGVENLDEIYRFVTCRYVSAVEAAWRLLEFKMHDRSHAVTYLPIHLPGFREIMYNENDNIELRVLVSMETKPV